MRCGLQTQHLTNLQLLQGGLNAPRHSIRSLKRGLSGPPYEVISARRHSVGKFIGFENSEREGGIITWRSLSGVDTRSKHNGCKANEVVGTLTAICFAFVPFSNDGEPKYFDENKC